MATSQQFFQQLQHFPSDLARALAYYLQPEPYLRIDREVNNPHYTTYIIHRGTEQHYAFAVELSVLPVVEQRFPGHIQNYISDIDELLKPEIEIASLQIKVTSGKFRAYRMHETVIISLVTGPDDSTVYRVVLRYDIYHKVFYEILRDIKERMLKFLQPAS